MPPDLEKAAEECYLSCLPTHGVNIAIAGGVRSVLWIAAALTAESMDQVTDAAIYGALYGERSAFSWQAHW